MKRIGVVAAMPGEIAPLVKLVGAKSVTARAPIKLYESERFVIAHAGIGKARVRLACEAVAEHRVRLLVSAGWVGALRCGFPAGTTTLPSRVVDDGNGEEFDIGNEGPTLLTVSSVLGKTEKAAAAQKFSADLVDMEAVHVARFARARRLRFTCVRGVSDSAEEELPDMQRFIRDGDFQVGRFVRYVAIRPWWWAAVTRMGKHSSAAAEAIAREIASLT